MIISAEELRKESTTVCISGKWVLARPCVGPIKSRILSAWKVLTGKCDALKWEKQ